MTDSRLDYGSGQKNCYSWIGNHTERDDEVVYAQVYMGVVYGNEVSMEGRRPFTAKSALRVTYGQMLG